MQNGGAISSISNALGYDLSESMLAAGCSLADVLARVNAVYELTQDMAPVSTHIVDSSAKSDAITIAPVRK